MTNPIPDMSKMPKALAGMFAFLLASCGMTQEDPQCLALRELAHSREKVDAIEEWITVIRSDAGALRGKVGASGVVNAGVLDADLDWDLLGIPVSSAAIRFFGESGFPSDPEFSKIDAIAVAYDLGYLLVFRLDASSRFEETLIEESKVPLAAEIKLEPLGPRLTLACQVNEFG